MEVDSMAVSLWPKTGGSAGLSGECCCKDVDGANSAFGNWIEIMVMRRAGSRMKRRIRPEFVKIDRLKLPFVIAMDSTDFWSRERLAVIVNRNANEGIKLGNSTFSCIDDFRLILEEFDHDESGVFIDEKRGVTEAAEKRKVLHFFEVDVKIARLGRAGALELAEFFEVLVRPRNAWLRSRRRDCSRGLGVSTCAISLHETTLHLEELDVARRQTP